MGPENCRDCIDQPEIAKNCSYCGWSDEIEEIGQAGFCHRLNGRGERIIVNQEKKVLDGSELVTNRIIAVGDQDISCHLVLPPITVDQLRNEYS